MNKFLYFIIAFFMCSFCSAEIVQDEIANNLSKKQAKPEIYTVYNYEPTEKIPIEIKIVDSIKSEAELYEGQVVQFKIAKDILYKDKVLFSRGTEVLARVSVIIEPGMNGIPASVIFSDINLNGISKSKLSNKFEVYGQDRSLLVFPLKWALTILPPTGSLTNFIMGGHVKLKPKEQILIYYYPDWK